MQSIFFSADFLMLCSIIELYNADLNRYFWIEVKILEITNHSNWDNSAEKAMSLHSSTLAWIIPWMEEPGRVRPMVLLRVRHDWLHIFTFTFHFHALEKETANHSSVLAWRIPGMQGEWVGVEPGGLPSRGSHRVGHDWSDLAAAAAADNSAWSSKSS